MATSRSKKSTNVRFIRWVMEAIDRVSPSLAGELALRAFLTPAKPARPEREREILASATSIPMSAGGLPLAAWSWGPSTAPVVLLVHGWAGRGAQLGALVPALLAHGRRVVTWDAPAHGDSPGKTTTLVSMAEVLREVAARVGPVEAVIAHSFGCAATTIALARGLAVERVVYVAPLYTIGQTVDRFARTFGLSEAARRDFDAALAHANLAARDDVEGAQLAPGMTAPLYVVHDRDDREVPYAEGVATARAWPDARMLTTGGLGHRRVLTDPEVVAAIADFAAGMVPGLEGVLDEATMIERELANPERRRVNSGAGTPRA